MPRAMRSSRSATPLEIPRRTALSKPSRVVAIVATLRRPASRRYLQVPIRVRHPRLAGAKQVCYAHGHTVCPCDSTENICNVNESFLLDGQLVHRQVAPLEVRAMNY